MAVTQVSARESLHWLDWFVRVRRALLAGVCFSIICGAGLLYVDLRMRGAVSAVVVVFSLAAPYVVLLITLFKALSIASSMAFALRQREQQLATARKELAKRGEARKGNGEVADVTAPETLATIVHDLREPLQLIESNVAVLSEAFGDILPVLDQHQAAGPHIRVARLDYPFFRDRVPVMLQDMTSGAARIAALMRDVTGRPRPAARRAEAAEVNVR